MTRASASRIEVEEVNLPPRIIAGLRKRVAVTDLPPFFAQAIPEIAAQLEREGITPGGPLVTVYDQEIGNTFEVMVGVPVDRALATDALTQLRLPGGRAVQSVHAGPYGTLPETYGRLSAWFAGRHLQPPGRMWEEYLVGPDTSGDAGCLTRVVFPLR